MCDLVVESVNCVQCERDLGVPRVHTDRYHTPWPKIVRETTCAVCCMSLFILFFTLWFKAPVFPLWMVSDNGNYLCKVWIMHFEILRLVQQRTRIHVCRKWFVRRTTVLTYLRRLRVPATKLHVIYVISIFQTRGNYLMYLLYVLYCSYCLYRRLKVGWFRTSYTDNITYDYIAPLPPQTQIVGNFKNSSKTCLSKIQDFLPITLIIFTKCCIA